MASLENILADSYKVKYILTINLTILLFSIDPREMKTYAHLKISMQIFTAAIHNHQKLERTQMSVRWWTDRHINCGTSVQQDNIQQSKKLLTHMLD